MKKSLLIGIIGGAAVGAAASYLWSANNRSNLGRGLRNLGDKAVDLATGLAGGGEEEDEFEMPQSSTGRKTTGRTGSASTSRRG